MKIQVNTDRNIHGNQQLIEQVESTLQGELDRFAPRITRMEVHLSDENSQQKAGADDKRCLLEVRLKDLQPIAVTHHASDIVEAVAGAARKMKRSLDSTIGKLDAR